MAAGKGGGRGIKARFYTEKKGSGQIYVYEKKVIVRLADHRLSAWLNRMEAQKYKLFEGSAPQFVTIDGKLYFCAVYRRIYSMPDPDNVKPGDSK